MDTGKCSFIYESENETKEERRGEEEKEEEVEGKKVETQKLFSVL